MAEHPEACGRCYFFSRDNVRLGICHRYPKPEPQSSSHWCGEFRATEVALLPAPAAKMQVKRRETRA